MLSEININATVQLAQAVLIPIIASGGLHTMCDIKALCNVQNEGIKAIICGRSIYTRTLDFNTVQKCADALTIKLKN